MTEREAWLWLAEICDVNNYKCIQVGRRLPARGLCAALCDMYNMRKIRLAVVTRMDNKLKKHGPKAVYQGYMWQLGDLKSRAAFCRKMAKLCVRKKRTVRA